MSTVTPRRGSRPWHKDEARKPTPGKMASATTKTTSTKAPLIPEEYMEVGQQRLVVLSAFVAIQAYKIYELLAGPNPAFTVKYIFVDMVFLWFLPVLRIPWLTFPSSVTLVQCALVAIFNIFLGNNALSMTGVILGFWRGMFDKELSISGSKVRPQDLQDNPNLLGGQYMVKILPESTALLNPTKQSFCMSGEHNPVSIPVRLNATEPILIQLTRVDFSTLEETSIDFNKKDIKKYKIDLHEGIDEPLSYVGLPVHEPGLYRLKRVVDASSLDVRMYSTDVMVPNCPSAYILGASEDAEYDRCIGDTDTPKLVVDGVPPLKVKYGRSIKGREAIFSVQSVQPEGFKSPLIYGGLPQSGHIWRGDSDLTWASSSTVEVDMDTSLTTFGEWMYSIDEVEDAFGNLVNYTQVYDSRDDVKLLRSKKLSYGFMVHPRPTIRFKQCNAENPIKLAEGQSVPLPMVIDGDTSQGPYTIDFEHISDMDGVPRNFTEKFSQAAELTVKESGVYKIKSIRGKFCTGEVLESSQCSVFVPPKPEFSATFEEKTDKCAGAIGVSADLVLTGTPPFRVAYQVFKDGNSIEQRSLTIEHSRYQFEYKPDIAGTYKYEFFGLDDAIYSGIDLERSQHSFEQTIRALAGASFVEETPRRRCCSGDAVDFEVKLAGDAPYKLDYEISYGNGKKTKHSEADLQERNVRISTPQLKTGGRYTITLVSVEDASGCKVPLNERDAVVEVRHQRPNAGFIPVDGSMNIRTLENHPVGLPLRLSGEGPWEVKYRHYDADDQEKYEDHTVNMRNANGEKITVRQKGRYELLDVHDAYCPGEVSDVGNTFELSWFNKPKLRVTSQSVTEKKDNVFVRNAVCEGDEDVFELGLEGAPPFSIYYDVTGPVAKNGEKVQVATKYANVRMITSRPGTYKYEFNKLADGIYDWSDLRGQLQLISVEQTIHPRPSAVFANKNRLYKACAHAEEDDPDTEPIQIQFKGKAPFTLTYNVRSESTGKSRQYTVQNIESKTYGLKQVYKGLSKGRHTVTLTSVHDSQGCTREMFNDDDKVTIIVSDVPDLANVDSRTDYCVGERVSFGLTGLPPFEVVYEFNGKTQKASTSTPFSRLASQQGTLKLVSISDSASSCSRKLHNEPIKVHAKPTVSIKDDKRHELDIHEGDQAELTFKFSGTPPFAFTYTRSERVGKPPRHKVIETHSVPEINGYEYTVQTSMQGIYEVIAVKDAYCSAERKSG